MLNLEERKWKFTRYEQGDCIYEGIETPINGKMTPVAVTFICGIDNLGRFDPTHAEEEGCWEEVDAFFDQNSTDSKILQAVIDRLEKEESVNIRVDSGSYGS